jgi:hypothetical protein
MSRCNGTLVDVALVESEAHGSDEENVGSWSVSAAKECMTRKVSGRGKAASTEGT